MITILKKIIQKIQEAYQIQQQESRLKKFFSNGKIPWSIGYEDYKWEQIKQKLEDKELPGRISTKELPFGYGKGIDERIIEYPWILSKLKNELTKLLDAGSTFNFETIVNIELIAKKELTIFTYFPEPVNFNLKRISYHYGDLRSISFRDQWFDEIVCQSTLEHIDMDNSMYGYSLNSQVASNEKNYEFMHVVYELERTLKSSGTLLMTVPFGRYERHSFFQQFDSEMISRIISFLKNLGKVDLTYFKYEKEGWMFSDQANCENSISFNPNTGAGKGDDGAAHSRAICCIYFAKEK